MRVAIIHDYIKEYGGAERVLEALHEIFPDAPVFTTVYLPEFLGPHKERFEGWDIRTSFLQNFPLKAKLISPFRLLSSLAFKSFDFSKFDIVITSATGAYIPNAISNVKYPISNKPIFITYCHTPPRYLYGYHTARDWKRNPVIRVIGEIANHFLRIADFNASRNVDFYIANSKEVASRIKKFYRRESVVVYPPVDISSKYHVASSMYKKEKINTKYKIHNTNYYLCGGRIARSKGMDIIVEAFSELGLPLKIFGKGFGGFQEQLKVQSEKLKVANIEFLGEVSDEEKLELMRNAKAFIFASYDEDFGITPVEAMSVGTPVIAFRSGGVKETVINGKTGLFYEENNAESLIKAVEEFETLRQVQGKKLSENCIKQAEKFSKERFKKSITDFINKIDI